MSVSKKDDWASHCQHESINFLVSSTLPVSWGCEQKAADFLEFSPHKGVQCSTVFTYHHSYCARVHFSQECGGYLVSTVN